MKLNTHTIIRATFNCNTIVDKSLRCISGWALTGNTEKCDSG